MSQIKTKFLTDLAVTAAKLASDSVTTAKILNANVTGAKIESSVALAGSPTTTTQSLGDSSTKIATTAFVQAAFTAAAAGLDPKQSVRAIKIANLALSGGASLSVDGVALANGDRVLLVGQTAGAENGIYSVSGIGSAYALTRSTDADSSSEVTANMFTFVSEGSVYADTGWVLVTNDPIVLDTTALVFTQFSGGASVTSVNGQSGTVVLNSDNIAEGSTNLYFSDERAQDAVGSILVDSSTIDFTYSDGTPSITAAIIFASAGALEDATGARVRVDGATVKINGSNNLEGLKPKKENFTLSGTNITNQYVDLAQVASTDSIMINVDGVVQLEGTDYTVSYTGGAGSKTRISFAGDLATGGGAALIAADIFRVMYMYL